MIEPPAAYHYGTHDKWARLVCSTLASHTGVNLIDDRLCHHKLIRK